MSQTEGPATVWSHTWVATTPPFEQEHDQGFAVVWADLKDGARVQAVVPGASAAPEIGSAGTICVDDVLETLVFVPEEAP